MMGAKRFAFAAGLGCIAVLAVGVAGAQEKRVVDQLLEILRQNKQISEQQYRELKRKADEERQEDLRKAGAPPPVPPAPVAVAAPPPPAPTPSADALRAYFKNGFNLETTDGNFKFNVGGLAQVDWNISDPSGPVKKNFTPNLSGTYTGVEFRRARLYIAGLVYGNIDFKFEYDFAGGSPNFKDVYIGMSKIPYVQYVRVGHFKEPFSLEELTPDTYTTFQERALNNAFAQPDRNTGVTAYQTFLDQRITLAEGGFRLTDNFGNGFGSDSPYDIDARLTGLPLYQVGDSLLHLGLSYSHKFRHDTALPFASRPEAHLFPVNLVNTGNVNSRDADVINPEVAFVRGPVSVQGEYTHVFASEVNHPNPQYDGFYVEGSYFLTGESRASFYRTQFGHFERVSPINNFSIDGSHWGAWQVAARFSRLDLNASNIDGGALDDITAGLNWYLNPVTRITVNYVWSHLEGVGDSNVVEGRFQLSL